MKKQSKDVERYLKAVGKQLRIARKEKKQFLEGYRSYIWDYIEEEGRSFDYNKLVRFFGTPASVAENYVWAGNGQDGVAVEHKYMQYALYGVLGLLILLCVSVLSYVLVDVFVNTPAIFLAGKTNTLF